MGEVYRARDTRLDRHVAVKVLPTTHSPDARVRFAKEAKTISSLSHPYICALYDVGSEGDIDFLVMELVHGETLSQRLARGPMTHNEVLTLGSQIASALAEAHRTGVVHRDLKPGNVMLTKTGVKLMDFGLAQMMPNEVTEQGVTETSPVSAGPVTLPGLVVGTFQYMAPEQLEGKGADRRSDIWALGCVLYEMATGRRAFEGSTKIQVISAILRAQPRPLREAAPASPPALEHLIATCLMKEPNDRIQSAHDLRIQLEMISTGGVPIPTSKRVRTSRLTALALLLVLPLLALVIARVTKEHGDLGSSTVFEIALPKGVSWVELPRLSPDGRHVAFVGFDRTRTPSIWMRSLGDAGPRRLPGTERARNQFWSPDGRFLGYFKDGALYKIDLQGGSREKLYQGDTSGDGAWGNDGVILFDSGTNDPIWKLSLSDGSRVAGTQLTEGETSHSSPEYLPDGKHFLYVATLGGNSTLLKIASNDSPTSKPLLSNVSRAQFADGHIVYEQQGVLLARPFNTRTQTFLGDAVAITDKIAINTASWSGGAKSFSVSARGGLVYCTKDLATRTRLVWLDRSGRQIAMIGNPAHHKYPSLSPDGTMLALGIRDPDRQVVDLWTWDLTRDVGTRITFTDQDADFPTWAPDGRRLVYRTGRYDASELRILNLGQVDVDSLLLQSLHHLIATSWSVDGRILYAVNMGEGHGKWDVYSLRFRSGSTPEPILTSPGSELFAESSPGGDMLAYRSDESGQREVYVEDRYGTRTKVSTSGGTGPRWRGDGRELYYLSFDGNLMAVGVSGGHRATFSTPLTLFHAPLDINVPTGRPYDVTRDGQKFLFAIADEEREIAAITVVQNWLAATKGSKR